MFIKTPIKGFIKYNVIYGLMTKPLPHEIKMANKIKYGKIRSERVKADGNPFFGKRHSEKSKELNRIAHLNKASPRKGKHHSEESKQKIRMARMKKIDRDEIAFYLPISGINLIPLTRGQFAVVDSKDFEKINGYNWICHRDKNTFYAQRALPKDISGKQKSEKLHHAILGKPPKGLMIDHINGNGLDNRRSNLRFVTNRENSMNRHDITSSRYPGVTWNKRSRCWVAQAQIKGKHIHIGSFPSEELAHKAYCEHVNPPSNQ